MQGKSYYNQQWIYVNTLDKKVERLCSFFEFLSLHAN